MPTGLKETSSLISIGFSVTETAADTFTQGSIDLQLNPLDNEVFVVYAIDLDLSLVLYQLLPEQQLEIYPILT